MHSKTALIAVSNNSAHLAVDLPYLLKKGGYRVTMIASPHWSLKASSYIDEFIEAPQEPSSVLDLALSLQRSFDLPILGTDPLIWALYDRGIDWSLSPVKNREKGYVLEGKIGIARFCEEEGFLAPLSKTAATREEAAAMAQKMGFPVLLKVSRSGGGNGVIRCDDAAQILSASIPVGKPFLVQQFIKGATMSVEPLFLEGKLVAYGYSEMTFMPSVYAPSLERFFQPCPDIEPILEKIGRALQVHGFLNISLVREQSSGAHYLIEIDFRPNRWIRQGQFVGIDWAAALRGAPLQRPRKTLRVRHFPADFLYGLEKREKRRLLFWLFNLQGCWKWIPTYDKKILAKGVCRLISKLFFSNY